MPKMAKGAAAIKEFLQKNKLKTIKGDIMEIAIGSKWQHKDGAIVEVSDVVLWKNAFYVIEYKFENNRCGVATRLNFLDNFKFYEPVYEYQWAYVTKQPNSWARLTVFMTEEQCTLWQADHGEEFGYQRLDFTKRGRKC